jgi:hypothetical protein
MTPRPKPTEKPETSLVTFQPTMPPGKHPSEWTQAEVDAYIASFPPGTRFYGEDEVPGEDDVAGLTDDEWKALLAQEDGCHADS